QHASPPARSRASTDSSEPRTVTTWCLRHRSHGPPGIGSRSGRAVPLPDTATVAPSTTTGTSHGSTRTTTTPSVTETKHHTDVLRDAGHPGSRPQLPAHRPPARTAPRNAPQTQKPRTLTWVRGVLDVLRHHNSSRDRTRTYNLPVNSRTLCQL